MIPGPVVGGGSRAVADARRALAGARRALAATCRPTPSARSMSLSGQGGVVSLEWVLTLPLLALALVGLLEVGGVVRDALRVHDAARAGVRAAATSTGSGPAEAAVAVTVGDLEPRVTVRPRARSAGELVEVTVTVERRLGPVTHPLTARAVARVEPVVAPGRGVP